MSRLAVNGALHRGLLCGVSGTVGCAPDLVESGASGEGLVYLTETPPKCREKISGCAAPQAVGIIRAFSELARHGQSIVYCT